MPLSKEEQITALEEQIKNTTGPGSKKRKEELQSQLDDLLEENEDSSESESVKVDNPDHDIKNKDLDVHDWVKGTPEQAAAAEKAGKLCGYDPDKGLMLVRK